MCKSHAWQLHSPISRLNIKEVAFMSAWNKFNTSSRGNVLHPSFYGDSIHVICHKRKNIMHDITRDNSQCLCSASLNLWIHTV